MYKSQKVYTITTYQWVMYKYTYNIFVSKIDKNNRHLSGYDQISFIVDDAPTRNNETTLTLLKYEMTAYLLK